MTQRFFDKVSPEPNSGCWLWTGAVNNKGYGRFGTSGYAHRFSYEFHKGPVGSMCVLHTCDNPCCVNPDHLVLGTMKENSQDMVRKGRNNAGKGKAKRQPSRLTAAAIEEIVHSVEKQSVLAARFGIDQSYVCHIRKQRRLHRVQ